MTDASLPERTYYEHTSECDEKTFEEPNVHGLKRCKHCSGIFDEDGNGVATTDRRLNRRYFPEIGEPK